MRETIERAYNQDPEALRTRLGDINYVGAKTVDEVDRALRGTLRENPSTRARNAMIKLARLLKSA